MLKLIIIIVILVALLLGVILIPEYIRDQKELSRRSSAIEAQKKEMEKRMKSNSLEEITEVINKLLSERRFSGAFIGYGPTGFDISIYEATEPYDFKIDLFEDKLYMRTGIQNKNMLDVYLDKLETKTGNRCIIRRVPHTNGMHIEMSDLYIRSLFSDSEIENAYLELKSNPEYMKRVETAIRNNHHRLKSILVTNSAICGYSLLDGGYMPLSGKKTLATVKLINSICNNKYDLIIHPGAYNVFIDRIGGFDENNRPLIVGPNSHYYSYSPQNGWMMMCRDEMRCPTLHW